MNANIYQQLFNLIIFFIAGILIGVLFDIFRIMRRTFKTSDIITYIQDVLFWILTGFILLFTIFTFNNGELRVYAFVGMFCGSAIYLLTISKYFIKLCVVSLEFIKKLIYVPMLKCYNIIKKFVIHPFSQLVVKIKNTITKYMKKTHET